MQRMLIALCDDDISYSRLFMEAAREFSGGMVQVRVFSGPERLKEFLEGHSFPDLILIHEKLFEEWKTWMCNGGLPVEYLCVLTESERKRRFELGGAEWASGRNAVPGVCIYQDITVILQTAEQIVRGRECKEQERTIAEPVELSVKESGCELIGFYSPVRRTGQSTYARNIAEKEAEKVPVLFISLESYAGIHAEREDTLADLLYYMKQEEIPFGKVLERIIFAEENVHEILPMPLPIDLWGITEKQWIDLFSWLKEKSIYQKIYIDFGDGSIQGLFEILDMCSVVYTAVADDRMASGKLAQYERTLQILGKESIRQKTKRIYLRTNAEKRNVG